MSDGKTRPVLKGVAEVAGTPEHQPGVRVAFFDDDGGAGAGESMTVRLVTGIKDICDLWLKDLRAGMRVTVDGQDWQLAAFEQHPSPGPTAAWNTFWCVRCELRR